MDLRELDHTDEGPASGSERRRTGLVAGVFAAIAALAAFDLLHDLREGTTALHAAVEGGIVAVGGLGLAVLLRRLAALRRREREASAMASALIEDLERSRAEAARWRQEARDLLDGLGVMIDRQFARWQLSPAESEVALLLLKGLSHKELAAVRGIGVATARQQAAAVYRKAGVAGRHDLAAFFLEDLLAPRASG
ncbi:MAG: LuxR family transcriptional regulator [Planctomycetes bacterium]|nr:LuxR family transcriptional regulator [Planctomycetota bacterium]